MLDLSPVLKLSARFKTFGVFLALIACTGSFGGHWVAPRIAIWTLMIIDYSRTTTLGKAVEETLTGERPCGRCHAMSLAQKAEQSQPPLSISSFKIELFLSVKSLIVAVRDLQLQTGQLFLPSNDSAPLFGAIEPPTPPPRFSC